MSIAPPEFLPVLLGHGCFLKDEYGHVRLDSNGSPPYHLIPSSDNFLYMRPSKQAQQFWPADPAQKIPNGTSIVLLSVAVNTLCMRPDLITEIGITMYDTASIYDGVKSTKKKTPGCIAPGPRGEDITKFARSRHFIVQDTAYHHPETCHEQCHTAQPYSFTYRKSEFIPRAQILERIEQAFFRASCEGLSSDKINNGHRRVVVLVGWGEEDDHPQIKAASWYKKKEFFQYWNMKQHKAVVEHVKDLQYLTCLETFGIQHRAHGQEIGFNAGNHTAFTIHLLIGLCFLTEKQRARLGQKESLEPSPKFPGVESVLARENRPPRSRQLPPRR
ncbi:hypothetical protein F5B17DRAFT_444982 [Nemania serpens]|nr:hypothetical protein F5B17DRAFT_444982 [Nemania serpens]